MDGMEFNIIVWIISMIILVIVELSTVGLYCVWFAFGALSGLVLAMLGAPIPVQFASFVAVSVVLFFFVRPKLEKKINERTIRTNSSALIGQTALALTDITEFDGGQVKVNGQIWSSKLEENNSMTIPKNSTVEVLDIIGVKLIVRIEEYNAE